MWLKRFLRLSRKKRSYVTRRLKENATATLITCQNYQQKLCLEPPGSSLAVIKHYISAYLTYPLWPLIVTQNKCLLNIISCPFFDSDATDNNWHTRKQTDPFQFRIKRTQTHYSFFKQQNNMGPVLSVPRFEHVPNFLPNRTSLPRVGWFWFSELELSFFAFFPSLRCLIFSW